MDEFIFLIREANVSAPTMIFPCLNECLDYVGNTIDTVIDCQDQINLHGHKLKHRWQYDAQQCGIDKQADSCASFLTILYGVNIRLLEMRSETGQPLSLGALVMLATIRKDILENNYSLHEFTCQYRVFKPTTATEDHHKLVSIYVDSAEYDTDQEIDLMDLEDVEVQPKRKNADEMARREAYLWDHEIAVRAETTGPGIKTRGKFHRHKTPEDIKKCCEKKK